jgi:4-amino-4-deoxy-L-arabinose transferase-like glycosyltransferase
MLMTQADAQPSSTPALIAATPRLFLKTILALAVASRLLIVWIVLTRYPHGWFFRSQGELGFLADSLRQGHGLSSPFGGSTGPTAFLAPGYPAIIAVIFFLFGSFTTAAAAAILLLQTLFGILTILLIVRIANREFGATAANIAGIFWAIGIPFIWLPAVFWETSLSILLLIGAIALALYCARAPSLIRWALMGIYCGFTLLLNPSFLFTLFAILGWILYETRSRPRFGPWLGFALLLLVFAPWPIRNARVLHAYIPLRSNLGFELWKGNRPGATSLDDPSLYPVTNRPEFNAYASKGEVVFMKDKFTAATANIESHPREFLRLSAVRFARYWTGTGSTSLFLALHSILTTLLAIAGLWMLWKQKRRSLATLFFLPLLLFPLPYYITHAEVRFRIIVEPITTILAAYAIVQLWTYAKERRSAIVKVEAS